MKKLFEHISRKLGLTNTEIKTFLFIVVIFLLGWAAKEIKFNMLAISPKEFKYSYQDSLFKAVAKKYKIESSAFKKNEKRVDSDVELSDFSNDKLDSKKNNIDHPNLKFININTADEKALIKVPGIGNTIAKRIIKLRTEKGRFNNLNELIEVKRIGQKKLEVIKKYLYIEK